MATESLDTSSAERWARLREDVRRCQLRRGAWYPVLSLAPDEAVLEVRRKTAIVPLAYLEVVRSRPKAWTLIPSERYDIQDPKDVAAGIQRRYGTPRHNQPLPRRVRST